MWSRSQERASTWHLGKMQWSSRRWTRSRIQPGGSWELDRIPSLHVQHGLDDDLVVADPVPDLGEGGGAEPLDLADGEGGVGLEVAGVDADVRFDFALFDVWGWPVRMLRALTLRTPNGEVSPSSRSWRWATVQRWS